MNKTDTVSPVKEYMVKEGSQTLNALTIKQKEGSAYN
jgi:hypothetical protein